MLKRSILFSLPLALGLAFSTLGFAKAPVKTAAKAPAKVVAPAGNWLLDDFETMDPGSRLGTVWFAGCDDFKLGSIINPHPFKITAPGSPASPKGCAMIKGHVGKNEAPWPWCFLGLDLSKTSPLTPVNLSGYKAVRFYVKGDGKIYVFEIARAAVKDYAEYASNFKASAQWTLVTMPLDEFEQPSSWGNRVPKSFADATAVHIKPIDRDTDFFLYVDDITFVK